MGKSFRNKMWDDFVAGCDEETQYLLNEYDEMVEKAMFKNPPGSFIICSEELAKQINDIQDEHNESV
jgi:hypothetical protein